MKSIILVGMPGCGKSTLGVLIAKELGLDFVDTDIVIQSRTGELLHKTLERVGVEGLLEEEEKAILSLDFNEKAYVVSTGGSAVLRENSMKHLCENGVVVYLRLSCGAIKGRINNMATRGIAAKPGETLEDIYNYRTPYYEKYAEITVDCEGNDTATNVEKILAQLKNDM